MEYNQAGYHALKGKYLAYASPAMTKKGRSMMLFSPFDPGVRTRAKRFLGASLANPVRLFDGCIINP